MLILLLMLFITFMILQKLIMIIWSIYNKIKIDNLLEGVNAKEDFVYMSTRDFQNVAAEVLKRKGYKVRLTDKCGEWGNGLMLNNLQYAEIWKHSLNHLMEVETAMKLAKCMQSNLIYRGMLITLGDFKQNTRLFCHKNVIECINGEQFLAMCKEVQKRREIFQPG